MYQVPIYSALDSILPKTQYSSLALKMKGRQNTFFKKTNKKNEIYFFRIFSFTGLIDTDSFLKLVIRMFPLFLTVHLVGIIVLLFNCNYLPTYLMSISNTF